MGKRKGNPTVSIRAKTLLFVLIVAAFWLRFFQLADNPAGLFRDEADKGYTSYSLLQTGMDQAGHRWPLFVRALNVTTSAVYQYIDLPFIAALGLNELAIRLPACLAGTLSVLAVFLLARRWWGESAALWAGLFVCLSPWSLLLSRWANQSILLTLFIPLGVFFHQRDSGRGFPSVTNALLSAFCFLLAFYTYRPAHLVVPVLVGLMWMVSLSRESFRSEHRWAFLRSFAAFWVLFAVGMLPLLHHIFYQTAESSARFTRITIFDGRPAVSVLQDWLRYYWYHLSPDFLFVRGDGNLRHNTWVFGQAHWYLAPLVIVGIVRAFVNRSRTDRILLAWFFCFPIAAACTWESVPHALRSVFAIPVIQLMAVNGICALRQWKPYLQEKLSPDLIKAIPLLWVVSIPLCAGIHLYDLTVRYPRYSAASWECGYREAIEWWQNHRDEADGTVVSGLAEYPYVFFLMVDRYPPQRWIDEQRIDGVEFMPLGSPLASSLGKVEGRYFFLARPRELQLVQPLKVIRTPGGEAIWKWVAWGQRREIDT